MKIVRKIRNYFRGVRQVKCSSCGYSGTIPRIFELWACPRCRAEYRLVKFKQEMVKRGGAVTRDDIE